MRNLLALKVALTVALAAVFLAPLALGQSYRNETYSYSISSSAAPTLSTDGVSLNNAVGYTVIASAASGEYFDGTGTLRCYYYGAVDGSGTFRWMRCKSTLDVSMSGTNAIRDVPTSEFRTSVGYGRIKYVPETVDAGALAIRITIIVRRVQ